MFQNTLVCILIFVVAVALAVPLGGYMNKVYKDRNSFLDFLKPFENFLFRICRINPATEMDWKQYLMAMAVINVVWFVFGFVILVLQGLTFGIFIFAVIIVLNVLSLFPSLMLGPVSDHLLLK
jgi:potassium-transporting ATPase potassium-binding subunit